MNLTETEKAYLAGLFDGEGSVGFYFKSKSGYHRAVVQISNSSPEIMDWLKARIPFGNICVANNRLSKYTNWTWLCSSKCQVKEFCETVRPYLVFKLKQVDLLLSLWNAEQKVGCGSGVRLTTEALQRRHAVMLQLKHLKTASYQCVP